MLKSEDFNNDQKDAGELGSGHSVTALYEIIPVGADSKFYKVDQLKYQQSKMSGEASSNEILTVKFRYKKPDEADSRLIVHSVVDENISLDKTSTNFRWASSVAAFGMSLRRSEFINDFSEENIVDLARNARGEDKEGYRAEFINLVKAAKLLAE